MSRPARWTPIRAVVACLTMLALAVPARAGEDEPVAYNIIAVVLDGSVTFKKRREQALERITELLDSMAQVKLHRWDPAVDRIVIISLDAIPDVLWEGTLPQLKAMDAQAWKSRFLARKDYACCTDVSAAFRLAAQRLQGDPRYVRKYLLAFTDLIHEPPTTSLCKCRPPATPSHPPKDFPWEALRDVSTSVFWVPGEERLAWGRAVQQHGLESFAIYSESESGEVTIAPPPRPEPRLSKQDIQRQQQKSLAEGKQALQTFGYGVAIITGGVLLLTGFVFVLARMGGRPGRAVGTSSVREPPKLKSINGPPANPSPRASRPGSRPVVPRGREAR